MKKGLLIINTGNGKGKTTAAFGIILRAVGHQLKSEVIQFIKQRPTGEIIALLALAPNLVSINQFGNGFTWESTDPDRDQQCARDGWNHAKKVIIENRARIVLLDEITYPVNDNLIDIKDVISVLQSKPKEMHIILTGRNAPAELIAIADCVSDMSSIKHHFEKKVPMQKGIEF